MQTHRDVNPRTEFRLSEPRPKAPVELGDLRFRALLTNNAWVALPAGIRRRFSKRLAGGNTVVYTGHVVETHMSRAGWWLAQAARLIGSPLPTARDAGVPSVVTVTEDAATGGQIWTRLYARRNGFPQVINSSKRFSGPTGLEEYIGYGISTALTVSTTPSAIVFHSAGYFVMLGNERFRMPRWLTPGRLCITHTELGDPAHDGRRFEFKLELTHPVLGVLIRQVAIFRESGDALTNAARNPSADARCVRHSHRLRFLE
jgi:Domain of unknown function (DUF4166)